MNDLPATKTVLDRLTPTVVRRRVVNDVRSASSRTADEPPPSSVFPHPDYNFHDDDEL